VSQAINDVGQDGTNNGDVAPTRDFTTISAISQTTRSGAHDYVELIADLTDVNDTSTA